MHEGQGEGKEGNCGKVTGAAGEAAASGPFMGLTHTPPATPLFSRAVLLKVGGDQIARAFWGACDKDDASLQVPSCAR